MRISSVFIAAVAGLILGGCRSVSAYERGHLAHPTMTPETPYAGVSVDHVRTVHEGATGGAGGAGGGCGCN